MLFKNIDYLSYIILTIITAYAVYIKQFCWNDPLPVCEIIDFGTASAWIGYASGLLAIVWLYITLRYLILKFWKRN